MTVSWFDEQIKQRKRSDRELFENALFEMASVVLDARGAGKLNDRRIVTKAVIDEVLKYYHIKPAELPDMPDDPAAQLEYVLRPHGIMYRSVTLSENWYKDAFGPLIAYRKADGLPVALLPGSLRGYWYRDAEGKKVPVNRKTMAAFSEDALCFYRPLPQRRLGIPDLLQYMKSCLNTSDVLSLVLMTVAVTCAGLLMPRLTRFLTGFVLESGNAAILWSTAAFMLSVMIVSQLLSISRTLSANRIQIKVSLSVEAAMMMRLMSLNAAFFRRYSSGELASRAGAINRLCYVLMGGVFSLGITAIASLLYIYQMFTYAPSLAKPALLIILLLLAVTAVSTLVQTRENRLLMERRAKESGMTYAMISGVQKIKSAGAEQRAFARWARFYSGTARMEYNPPLLLKLNSTVCLGVSLAGTVALYYAAVRSGVDPPTYLAFSAAFGAVTAAFNSFTQNAVQASQIRPILEMAEPILQAEPEASENRQAVTRLSGAIELSEVSFRYDDKMPYVIDKLSLKIDPGEYVAIVGTTGCGKSTLMRLLLGFETPEKGAVYYDHKNLNTLDLASLRRQMGVVTQDSSLFQGDIFSNIAVSAPRLTLEEAWAAAELAGIADEIRAMPMGMHTMLSEGQGAISGGQKQRLLIARAVASRPKILLFDEATSALDNMTQKRVSQALDGLRCTRIVIAHRLSTIRNCDRILVLDRGGIIESGTYQELIDRGGFFAKLVERQRIDT